MLYFDNIEELKTNLENHSDRLNQIIVISEYLLNHLKATSISKSKSTNQIFEKYESLKSEFPEYIPDIPKNTFVVYLSKISSQQGTRIICPGKRQGYYLDSIVDKIEKIEETKKKQKPDEGRKSEFSHVQEKSLYPILKDWLFEKDYDRVADTSSLRANGKWGNPDLVALKIEDIYGFLDIEITTIEVKLLDDNWEQWIFEAIAHTRFSNRSYFAFAYPENLFNKLDSTDIKLYAEHFNIGILVLELDGESYLKIKSKEPIDLNPDEIRIIEYCQAPHNQTHIKFRKKFLQALDLLDLKKLYKFGEELD